MDFSWGRGGGGGGVGRGSLSFVAHFQMLLTGSAF